MSRTVETFVIHLLANFAKDLGIWLAYLQKYC